jgi:tRNA (cmo5U34)-methyltransferase
MHGLHLDFKRAHGCSELDINGKRAALEQVWLPDNIEVHEAGLREAGFARGERWFQCLNVVGWLAWP